MELSDCGMVRDMFNNPEIESLVVGWAFPVSAYAQEQWLKAHCGDRDDFRFVIESPEDGAVGIATLTGIDWKNRRATHGIKLANKERRLKGIGTDAVMAIMRYAFDELGLHRLDGSWFEENTASRRLYSKLGWKEEGRRREYIHKGGVYRDLIVTGILGSDYYRLLEETHYWDDLASEGQLFQGHRPVCGGIGMSLQRDTREG